MKTSNLLLALTIGLFFSTAYAAETLYEKGEATKNEIKRDASKAVNRVEEATCTGTDVECAKKKVDNRVEEGKDLIKDKSSEVKNKID
ncbi:hypothetical protein C8R34_1038 [Nitrosomonas sp. Nm84]|uniref:hypothetical protein n=1 Tax=Nitrosomonas sp. Nm84 TaxID=200124 RepID=UPI000D7637BC|nr:hypothetical protein [Nitrosomonas sp. Nm84]PXW89851.1 hypothetical protein C8R34_1038 [Nitrosomonas sp. Nm84]